MTASARAPLLSRLRTAMAQANSKRRGDWQSRLNDIVALIASSMEVAVCSVYMVRDKDKSLELCASKGLKAQAVHKTHLAQGEGLVGDIALHRRVLNVADASKHPNFALRAETGEQKFAHFAGVPILSAGRVIGVLVVQNADAKAISEAEMEDLQTIAMVLAEMLANVVLTEQHDITLAPQHAFEGVGLVEGVITGEVILHDPHIELSTMIAENVEEELARLEAGIYALRQSVDKLLAGGGAHWGETFDVLETYQMFANDEGWRQRMGDVVRTGLTAEAAVGRVLNDMRARLTGQRDIYLQERLHDLEDLSHRLLHILSPSQKQSAAVPRNAVLVAHSLGASDLLDYRDTGLRAVVLEEGSPSAHATIVARTLGFVMVGQVHGITTHAREKMGIIVDGTQGRVHLTPSAKLVRDYRQQAQARAKEQKSFARIRQLPSITKDGTEIALNINAGLLEDVQNLAQSGAKGVGLFRTELQFLIAARMPRLAEQAEFYRKVLLAAGEQPLIFRTLDIGGDKIASYMPFDHEQNPALGWRALRVALDRKGFLRYQARALLQAAAGRELRLMFPFVSTTEEYLSARALVMQEYDRAKHFGKTLPRRLQIGAMLEVPSLLWELDRLLPHTDFLSIGSNDLAQFLFASDRTNARLQNRYDIITPAGVSVLVSVIDACKRHKVPLSLCGEMAGNSLDALVLIGLGMKDLSMSRSAIGPVKRMVRSLPLAKFQTALQEVIAPSATGKDWREQLRALAHNLGVKL